MATLDRKQEGEAPITRPPCAFEDRPGACLSHYQVDLAPWQPSPKGAVLESLFHHPHLALFGTEWVPENVGR